MWWNRIQISLTTRMQEEPITDKSLHCLACNLAIRETLGGLFRYKWFVSTWKVLEDVGMLVSQVLSSQWLSSILWYLEFVSNGDAMSCAKPLMWSVKCYSMWQPWEPQRQLMSNFLVSTAAADGLAPLYDTSYTLSCTQYCSECTVFFEHPISCFHAGTLGCHLGVFC